MNRILLPLLALGLSLAPVLCRAAEPNADQAKAIVEIEKMGGFVTIDEKCPDRPVTSVSLTGEGGHRRRIGASERLDQTRVSRH